MKQVLVPLANGFEEVEAITIIDLLRRAQLNVTTASLQDTTVQGAHGIPVIADTTLDNVLATEFDLIVLPGGLPGSDYLNADERIHALISKQAAAGKPIAAICAAPKVLIQNGLANGKNLTAYPQSLGSIDTSQVTVTGNAVEVDGNVITSRGPGTAMDFALQLVSTLLGQNARDAVEQQLVRA